MEKNNKIAIFGGGCFWCTEAIFQSLKGVISVMSGYTGGETKNPTYEQICAGDTGHAEVITIEFNPAIISYNDLLTVFFATHDPTTMNRQGNDAGTQYRSIIFYTDERQKNESENYIKQLNASAAEGEPIVTIVAPVADFYPAEKYHQNYYKNNARSPYCEVVINPKLAILTKRFGAILKKSE